MSKVLKARLLEVKCCCSVSMSIDWKKQNFFDVNDKFIVTEKWRNNRVFFVVEYSFRLSTITVWSSTVSG